MYVGGDARRARLGSWGGFRALVYLGVREKHTDKPARTGIAHCCTHAVRVIHDAGPFVVLIDLGVFRLRHFDLRVMDHFAPVIRVRNVQPGGRVVVAQRELFRARLGCQEFTSALLLQHGALVRQPVVTVSNPAVRAGNRSLVHSNCDYSGLRGGYHAVSQRRPQAH